ncbi:MAG: peptidoglycan DD-metalloendopeptidase family protein [Myxococcota bacterium]|nr:peptidoglycan DD-metalloendopeptidase family protein [Myxococcota bacterium]
MIDFAAQDFHPVVHLPTDYEVLDFSTGAPAERLSDSAFTIGRYDEDRSIYTDALFSGGRSIHMGIDVGAPVGTPVHAFGEGRIFKQGYNGAVGDYGYTLVTHHVLGGIDLWALHGHLSAESVVLRAEGAAVQRGEVIGWIGPEDENGGWPPHLHVQLSSRRPETHDLPGVVTAAERQLALRDFPDPRLVLGPIY